MSQAPVFRSSDLLDLHLHRPGGALEVDDEDLGLRASSFQAHFKVISRSFEGHFKVMLRSCQGHLKVISRLF